MGLAKPFFPFAVAAWRETPYFSDAERAALALTEALTRAADRPDQVPDTIWDAAAEHFDETQLAALVLDIATVNRWNRQHIGPGGSSRLAEVRVFGQSEILLGRRLAERGTPPLREEVVRAQLRTVETRLPAPLHLQFIPQKNFS